MKVIIVEVTRAANTFGQTHLPRSARPTSGSPTSSRPRRPTARSAPGVTPQFAAMAFYGAIEQVLTGWIFGLLEEGEDDYERAKRFIVETICDGLEAHPDRLRA